MPFVSIITPVYNAEHYICSLIESVLNQTCTNWELILINDGSTDLSEVFIQPYLNDQRIKYVFQKNQGASEARNKGIEMAQSEWITFIDADDIILPNYLEALLQFKSKKNVDLVCGGYFEMNQRFPEGIPLHDFKNHLKYTSIIQPQVFIENIFNGLTGVLWSKLFRKDIIISRKLKLNRDLKLSEDLIFVLQYVKHTNEIGLIDQFIYKYNRLHENGLSSAYDLTYLDTIEEFNRCIQNEFEQEQFRQIEPYLKMKSLTILLQICKYKPNNPKELKQIIEQIDVYSYKTNLGLENNMYFYLLENNWYHFAFYYNKFINYLRLLKP